MIECSSGRAQTSATERQATIRSSAAPKATPCEVAPVATASRAGTVGTAWPEVAGPTEFLVAVIVTLRPGTGGPTRSSAQAATISSVGTKATITSGVGRVLIACGAVRE